MHSENRLYSYQEDGISFVSQQAVALRTIYFPLCGIDADSIKSSVTPFLSGDIKIDASRYLTKPVSTQDLRWPLRDFFCYVHEIQEVISLAGSRPGNSSDVEAGPLWHKLACRCVKSGLSLEAVNFVPVTGGKAELMRVRVKNISKKKRAITPTFSLPIFGRALVNKHDHEHVTSLLHRIQQLPEGVLVRPTMLFDERGHSVNDHLYYVFGREDKGRSPIGSFPTVESFYGEGGDPSAPEAVARNVSPVVLPDCALQGKEAMGALRFPKTTILPGQSKEYFIVMGIGSSLKEARKTFHRFDSAVKFDRALEKNKAFWLAKSNSIVFRTNDAEFNSWMRWVTLQPVFRRIFGCSFLPDHDYGKGGKGWRDIWQDLLSLILIEPEHLRETLINNFAGVRIDGSNATIIGSSPGEFIADRNAITRVWMDHGIWPLLTLGLYVHQTGDYDILLEDVPYFRDAQMSRTLKYDHSWSPDGHQLKDKAGAVYRGSIMEHVLIEHLVQFFNVGEHNIIRLENADWNDGLDMAFQRGESTALTSLYGGNLFEIADLLEDLSQRKGIEKISLAKELMILLDSIPHPSVPNSVVGIDYSDIHQKKNLLWERYFPAVEPQISGQRVEVSIKDVVGDLRKKGEWIFRHIKTQERIEEGGSSWFNGYYDNQGRRVEGRQGKAVRMTLTGQVFPIMSGLADEGEIRETVAAVHKYLKDQKLGGYRLNTDFGLPHHMDLGRAFGFAYGTKENGSFFSHMNVMYAYGLYTRGFVREGHEVLRSIGRMCMDTRKSRIYPGIPEYFDSEGRGRYHYLTGSASWLVLTLLTQVFGVRGEKGDLILSPQLIREEFDSKEKKASVHCHFAGRKISVTYLNAEDLDCGEYQIEKVFLNNRPVDFETLTPSKVRIPRGEIGKTKQARLDVVLGR